MLDKTAEYKYISIIRDGRLTQLVECLLYTQNVSGSTPLPPTIFYYGQVAEGPKALGC